MGKCSFPAHFNDQPWASWFEGTTKLWHTRAHLVQPFQDTKSLTGPRYVSEPVQHTAFILTSCNNCLTSTKPQWTAQKSILHGSKYACLISRLLMPGKKNKNKKTPAVQRIWKRWSSVLFVLAASIHNRISNHLWHLNQRFKQKDIPVKHTVNGQWLHWKKTSAQRKTPAPFNMILWQSLSLQFNWETRALC